MEKVYENIKARRKELGMTMDELAKKVGYTEKSVIGKIEKGEIDLSLGRLEKIAEALNTTVSELLNYLWEGED